LSYINRNHARQTGTNRITQAEISNLLQLSFPGRVITRDLQLQLVEFSGGRSQHLSLQSPVSEDIRRAERTCN
jgi:hypothetical protein